MVHTQDSWLPGEAVKKSYILEHAMVNIKWVLVTRDEEVEKHHNWLCLKGENTNLENYGNAIFSVVINF